MSDMWDAYKGRRGLGTHMGAIHDVSLNEYEREQDTLAEGHACPACGRDDFPTERGMKIHHKRFCDESDGSSIAGVTLVCQYCGDDYTVSPYKKESSSYCSQECKFAGYETQLAGENNPNWDEWVWADCEACDNSFKVVPSRSDTARACSEVCKYTIHSEEMSGESSPTWKGGHTRYGAGWTTELKEKIRERQDRLCLDCGKTEAENGRRLSVHHIQKVRRQLDSSPEVRHAEDGLVALCISCHRKWEQMSPLRPQMPD